MKNYESFLKRWQDGISKKVTRVFEKINSDNSLGGKLKMSTRSYVSFTTDDKCANFSQKKGTIYLLKCKLIFTSILKMWNPVKPSLITLHAGSTAAILNCYQGT